METYLKGVAINGLLVAFFWFMFGAPPDELKVPVIFWCAVFIASGMVGTGIFCIAMVIALIMNFFDTLARLLGVY